MDRPGQLTFGTTTRQRTALLPGIQLASAKLYHNQRKLFCTASESVHEFTASSLRANQEDCVSDNCQSTTSTTHRVSLHANTEPTYNPTTRYSSLLPIENHVQILRAVDAVELILNWFHRSFPCSAAYIVERLVVQHAVSYTFSPIPAHI